VCEILEALEQPTTVVNIMRHDQEEGILPIHPDRASVAENGSISPQWHHTICGRRRGRQKFNHGQGQWLKKGTGCWGAGVYRYSYEAQGDTHHL